MTAPPSTPGLLSAADLARQHGWNRTTAWRFLRRLERLHGAKLVRQKRTLYIARGELVACLEKKNAAALGRVLDRILERLDELEGRQNGLANDVRALRRAVGI